MPLLHILDNSPPIYTLIYCPYGGKNSNDAKVSKIAFDKKISVEIPKMKTANSQPTAFTPPVIRTPIVALHNSRHSLAAEELEKIKIQRVKSINEMGIISTHAIAVRGVPR